MIQGNLAARLLGNADEGRKFLAEVDDKAKPDWPNPCVQFLQGKIDEQALLKLADTVDKETEARCYLGLDHLAHGRPELARTHFVWVRDHGTNTFIEYTISLAELKRLDSSSK